MVSREIIRASPLTKLILPICGSGVDLKSADNLESDERAQMIFDFVDFVGGVTLYQMVNATGVVWIDGALKSVGVSASGRTTGDG